MPNTTRGYTYPDSSGHARLWEHFATLATTINTDISNLVASLACVQDENPDNNASPITVTTSASPGNTNCGVAFVAPASGKVLLHFRATFQKVAGTGQLFMGPEVKTGSTVGAGTLVYNPNLDPGLKVGGTDDSLYNSAATGLVTGLTPGASYNARMVHFAVNPASLTFNYFGRAIVVQPVF